MRLNLFCFVIGAMVLAFCNGCNSGNQVVQDSTESTLIVTKPYPAFVADSAYNYIKKQLAFGPRVPGLPSHKKCAEWLRAELRKYCDSVYFQIGTAITYDKKEIPVYNIIGSFNPNKIQRGMFASHWDSRPWGDQDTKDKDKPIPAANDGASGVGVLLELARQMKTMKPAYGVDIVFFDAEDYGKSEYENSFCLGSQYWGKNPHITNYKAQFGVLFDMVGGKNAQFWKETYSAEKAGWVQAHFWDVANELGFGQIFQNGEMGQIIDDHKYVFEATKIPMVDVIQYDPAHGFAPYWHTHSDNIESVDKATLEVVGKTTAAFIFNPPIHITPQK